MLDYFLIFLTFSRLKFDNSLSLKQSNFLTPPSFTKIQGLKFLTLRIRKIKLIQQCLAKAKRALQHSNLETISFLYRAKISNQGLRKENRLFERERVCDFQQPEDQKSVGKYVILYNDVLSTKKACRKGKLPYPHSAKEPLGGVAERGPGGTQ